MQTTVARHDGPLGSWEMVTRTPHPALRGRVTRYCGYVENTVAPLRRAEAASPDVTLIVSLGPSIRLLDTGAHHTSFVAGLDDRPSTTEHDGNQHGIQVDLTPMAARMLLGVPMHELSGRVVELSDVLGPVAARLPERLLSVPGWEARFDMLDALIARRLDDARPPPASVDWAWARLRSSHGRVGVADLAAEIGASRRHLSARFRDEVGLPPKPLARILRFRRAVDLLGRDDGARFAQIAQACGYYDQAHLNRDFRDFAGAAPGDYLARRLPDGGGVAA